MKTSAVLVAILSAGALISASAYAAAHDPGVLLAEMWSFHRRSPPTFGAGMAG